MFAVSMPNAATRSALVDTATKWFATASRDPSASTIQSRAVVALASVSSVPNVLEEMMNRVSSAAEVPDRLREVSGIDIGYETEGDFTRAVKLERLVRHDRPEVRSADADIDDVLYRLARVALEFAGAHAGSEVPHPAKHFVHVLDDVLPVDDKGFRGRHAQRHVQHGPVFRDVDVLAAEHRVPPLGNSRLRG